MATSVEQRRKIRALEAKRDALMQKKSTADADLKKVRAELKHVRKSRA